MSEHTVKMASALPKADEMNGLGVVAEAAVADSDIKVVAVVILDCKAITHDVDSGEDVPTFRVRRIEPVGRVDDKAALGRIASRAFESRTGKTVLPLDVEQELADVFGRLDPTTGEILDQADGETEQ